MSGNIYSLSVHTVLVQIKILFKIKQRKTEKKVKQIINKQKRKIKTSYGKLL